MKKRKAKDRFLIYLKKSFPNILIKLCYIKQSRIGSYLILRNIEKILTTFSLCYHTLFCCIKERKKEIHIFLVHTCFFYLRTILKQPKESAYNHDLEGTSGKIV